ncbi:MAG: hypothetical protein NC304_13750 [Robinsoniella sp.]|nr:hypothetical protein [Robinsoniella sp.]
MTDALGHVTEYEYNGNNEIVKVIRKGENGHGDIILTYVGGQLLSSSTDALGGSVTAEYDAMGNVELHKPQRWRDKVRLRLEQPGHQRKHRERIQAYL